MDNELIEKQIKNLSENAKAGLSLLINICETGNKIPNLMSIDDESVQFGIQFGDMVLGARMIFNISLVDDKNYLGEVSTYFPEDDVILPHGATREEALVIIQGSPNLGIHITNQPVYGESIEEAILTTLEYALENIETIISEASGVIDTQNQI